MSAKMRISPVSWIVSIETVPRAGEVYPPGTFKRGLTKTLDLQDCCFCWPWVLENTGVRSMLGFIRTSDTSQTDLRCPYTPHPAFYPRISWLRRGQIVWLQWSYQPWPPLWISDSRVTGPCVQSEPFAITWTGSQILGRTRSWSLSPSRKVLIRTSHLPPSPHGSNKL